MSSPPKPRGTATALIEATKKPSYLVRLWPQDLREEFEERAAIIEYDGGKSREVAEAMAFEMLQPTKGAR